MPCRSLQQKLVFGVCLFAVPLCRTLFGTSTFKMLSTMRTMIRYLTSQRARERERCLFKGLYYPIHWTLYYIYGIMVIHYGNSYELTSVLNVAQLHLVMSLLRLVHQGMCASATRGRSRSLPLCHVISQSKQARIGMHWNSYLHCCTVGQKVYTYIMCIYIYTLVSEFIICLFSYFGYRSI